MKKVALKIAYIGSNFYGFQRQPNFRTVEGELIKTLEKLQMFDNVKEGRFSIAGRTDRGVHSLGNVISFQSEKEVIINQINDNLPDDVQILAKAPVRFGFKPRYAMKRHYRYFFKDNFQEDQLDIKSIEKLSKIFEGTHDFTNFSKRDQKSPIRKIDKIDVVISKNPDKKSLKLYIDVFGESFLWNMVRKMMKVFYEVGHGDMDLNTVEKLFNPACKYNIKPLSPENLVLMNIQYKDIKFQYDDYASERFRRILLNNIQEYEKKYCLGNNLLFSMEDVLNSD
jgi:tRNA pseudouridine38-40 synthase